MAQGRAGDGPYSKLCNWCLPKSNAQATDVRFAKIAISTLGLKASNAALHPLTELDLPCQSRNRRQAHLPEMLARVLLSIYYSGLDHPALLHVCGFVQLHPT